MGYEIGGRGFEEPRYLRGTIAYCKISAQRTEPKSGAQYAPSQGSFDKIQIFPSCLICCSEVENLK